MPIKIHLVQQQIHNQQRINMVSSIDKVQKHTTNDDSGSTNKKRCRQQ